MRPDGRFTTFRIRSLVGLIPLFAVERLEVKWMEPFREFRANVEWFMRNRRHVRDCVHTIDRDGEITHVLTILNQAQLRRLTQRLRDPAEFLSEYGVRSLSHAHCKRRSSSMATRSATSRESRPCESKGETRTGEVRSGSPQPSYSSNPSASSAPPSDRLWKSRA